jgi:uncharacterized membrane protein YfcA
MIDAYIIAVIGATFLLAGAVKGVIGLGLPTISLALLTVALDLTSAMALLLIPSFVTNLWQGVVGGNLVPLLRRLWPFFLLATITVWIGALALTTVDQALLSGLLGVLLVIYAVLSLGGIRLDLTPGQEVWVGPLTGTVNGVLTGMTGSFVVPGVMYMQAIGLPRDMLVQAMGLSFTLSTVALAFALGSNDLITGEQGMLSAAAIVPAVAGMVLGQHVRRNLSEQVFRRIFFVSLLLLGGYIIVASLGRF